jgi:serine/threonine protein kinase/Flp pilus assembly protein TadD
LKLIGKGGMGAVYEAEDTRLMRRVALKTLLVKEGSRLVESRFLQEARIAGTLDHPNLVPVYDYGMVGQIAYYTMPLVKGLSLEEIIPFIHGRTDEPPPAFLRIPEDAPERTDLVLKWFIGALEGLSHAHGHGVIHRDIKPSNLMLDAGTGCLRLADFGLARARHLTGLTQQGALLGTVAYMSPEQVRRANGGVDHRADIYSVGVTLYRTLLDRLPYDADSTAAYLDKILTSAPDSPSTGPIRSHRDLETIVLKCMEKSPGHRYPTAEDLRRDIERYRRHEPISARPVGVVGRLARWSRRRPAVATLLSLIVVSIIVLGVLLRANLRSTAIVNQQESAKRVRTARYAYAMDRDDVALQLLSQAIDLDSESFDARVGRAMVIWRLAKSSRPIDLDQALEDLHVAARLKPGLKSISELSGRILRLLGNQADADRAMERSRELPPRIALDFYLLGDLAYSEKDCTRAIPLYDEAVSLDPQMIQALFFRGMCQFNRGRYDLAERDFRITRHLDPDHAIPANNLGNALTQLGRFEEAFDAYQIALELDPDHGTIHFNYGEALRSFGLSDRAEKQFRRALELDPGYSKTHINLGDVLAESGRLDEAAAHYREAIRLEQARSGSAPNELLLIAQMGLCDVAIGGREMSEASVACRTAARLGPADPFNHYNLAAYYMLSGDPDAALSSLERDVELGDTDYEYLAQDEIFRPLRENPRFKRLVDRMRAR